MPVRLDRFTLLTEAARSESPLLNDCGAALGTFSSSSPKPDRLAGASLPEDARLGSK